MIFSKRLLHALARNVAGDRGIVGLARDLVDLVDIDDAALRPLDIVVGGLEQLQDDVLDVLADIAGFGQRRRVGHRERHIENARQRLRQQRLAGARRADQQDVGLRQLDVVVLRRVVEALVMIVDGDREDTLGLRLADDVIVENLADFLGCRDAVAALHQRGFVFLADDVHAELDAFIANEHRRTCDQLADFVLALAAKRAVERVLRVAAADLRHGLSPYGPGRSRTLFSCARRSSTSNLPPAFSCPRPFAICVVLVNASASCGSPGIKPRSNLTRQPRLLCHIGTPNLTSHCHQFAFIKLSGRVCRQAAIYVPVAKLPRFAAASSHAHRRQGIYCQGA